MNDQVLSKENCIVAIVGGGTSGLALAAELKRLSVENVVVLEREAEAGGIPRHCGHYPFGLREYGRLLKGPQYAKRNVEIANLLGVDIRIGATVIALREGGTLEVSTDQRRYLLHTQRTILCTGVRESSRAQRFIGGDRPQGVMSTGALQTLSYLKEIRPFRKPVILGSELVSFSAIQTCAHLGIKPVAMVEERKSIIARGIFRPYLILKAVPLFTSATDSIVVGQGCVEALRFTDRSGRPQEIKCDGVIVSGRFRPESDLIRGSHLDVDQKTGGPVVDQFGRTSDPVYFCTGNIVRPAETSGFCWREGVAMAQRIAEDLRRGETMQNPFTSVVVDGNALQFAIPQRITLTDQSGGVERFYLGLNEDFKGRVKIITGNDQELWSGPLNSKPVRRIQIPIPKVLTERPPEKIKISIEKQV